ncbi:pilus assembly protein [Pseudomonas sp. D(2018)]|uniref:AAA family ATPase n=1 Tax=Pseudomonas sp. D(2018) TaxID=2502238 RepID=UPI0010F857DB|nr:pilus assembly protein [Pseudomonas sp. D(2018)]
MSQTFLAFTRNSADLEWLQGALTPLGQVLSAGRGALDELLGLIEVTGASLLFVGLDRDNLVAQTSLIEGALAARPMLAVVAMGDGLDNQLVLNAMRAGARDFIAYGARTSEVAGLVRRLVQRLPSVLPNHNAGRLTALFSRQQDSDSALLSAHLALSIQQCGQRTLLLDLAQPQGDSLALLGLEASFHFADALRNLRRLDTALIDSAFGSHAGGLRLLVQESGGDTLERINAAELYLLLGVLRQHFQHIVVNLVGQPDSEALRILVGNADQLLWCTDQSVPDCRRNLELLGRWRDAGIKLEHAQLLVDRHLRGVAPETEVLARSFNLPVAETLPYSPELRLNAKNQGRSLFELAPRERLSQRLRQLGERLACIEQPRSSPWQRLWGARS